MKWRFGKKKKSGSLEVGGPSHAVPDSPRPSSAFPEEGRPSVAMSDAPRPSSVAPGAIVPYVPPEDPPADPHPESVGSAHPSREAGRAGGTPIGSASDSRVPTAVYPPANVVEPYLPHFVEEPAGHGPYIAPGPVPEPSGSFHWSYSIPELSPLPIEDHPMAQQPPEYHPPASDHLLDFANQMAQQFFAPNPHQQQSEPALTEGRISDGRTPFPGEGAVAAEAGPSQPVLPHIDEPAANPWEHYVPPPIPGGYAYYPQTMVPTIAYQGIFTLGVVCTSCYQTEEHESDCIYRHIPIHPIPRPACLYCDQAGHDILLCPYNSPHAPPRPPTSAQRLPHHPPLPHPDSGRPTEGSVFCAFCGAYKMHWHL